MIDLAENRRYTTAVRVRAKHQAMVKRLEHILEHPQGYRGWKDGGDQAWLDDVRRDVERYRRLEKQAGDKVESALRNFARIQAAIEYRASLRTFYCFLQKRPHDRMAFPCIWGQRDLAEAEPYRISPIREVKLAPLRQGETR